MGFLKNMITNYQQLQETVKTATWQPSFEIISEDRLQELAEDINKPHEDNPVLVEITASLIRELSDSIDIEHIDEILNWSIASYIQKELWKVKEQKIGDYLHLSYRNVSVSVNNFIPPQPMFVPDLLKQVFENAVHNWIECAPEQELEVLTQFYKEFETVHPFNDLNGRVGAILINVAYYKMRGKYLKHIVKPVE